MKYAQAYSISFSLTIRWCEWAIHMNTIVWAGVLMKMENRKTSYI